MADDPRTPQDFGAQFKGFMEQMARQAPAEEPFFRRRLREHFGSDPSKLTIVAEKFDEMEHPNVHLAVEAFTTAPGRSAEVLGVSSETLSFGSVGFAQLVANERGGLMG